MMNHFFILKDFPDTCPTFYGPHSVQCLNTVWLSVGCLPEGENYPQKLSSFQTKPMMSLTYMLVICVKIATCTIQLFLKY